MVQSSTQALLDSSLAAARQDGAAAEEEKVFHILDHVYLGTRFGAASKELLEGLGIGAVINVTAGSSRVPNYFEELGMQYLHLELMDELMSDPLDAASRAYKAISWWGHEGTNVLVHCQAGLSRSTTVVIAWLLKEKNFSLAEAAALISERRGRRPKVNPSFWCFLAGLERELRGWKLCTPPSFDFTAWLLEDLATIGLDYPVDRITKALHEDADWVNFPLFYIALCGWSFDKLVAAQLVAQSPHPTASSARKAANIAQELMEVYHSWPALQVFSLRILQQLVGLGDAKLCASLVSTGGVSKAMKAMQASPELADVQEAGCGIFAYLAVFKVKNVEEICLLGGVEAVLGAMQSHPGVEQVQATGVATLFCMTQAEESKTSMLMHGAVQVVLSAMWAHPTVVKVQEFSCAVLGSLAADPMGRTNAIALGAIEAIMRAMMSFPTEVSLQQRASKSLLDLGAYHNMQGNYWDMPQKFWHHETSASWACPAGEQLIMEQGLRLPGA